MDSNYYAITPIKALIRNEQIKNCKDGNCFSSCEVLGITLYDKEALTFLIKLEDGEAFRYIPITSLYWKEPNNEQFTMDELIYHNNKSDQVKISEIETLKGESACYIFQKDKWLSGEYVLSVDYYKNERMLNLMKLENGQFALLPFHKIKFKNINDIEKKFDRFKKQDKKFTVIDN